MVSIYFPSRSLQWKAISPLFLTCSAFSSADRRVVESELSGGRSLVPGVTGVLSFANNVGTDSSNAGTVDFRFAGPSMTPRSMRSPNSGLNMESRTVVSTFWMLFVTMGLTLSRQPLTFLFRSAQPTGS